MAPDERSTYIEEARKGAPEVGAAVAGLLAGADAATFLDTPAAEFAAPILSQLPADLDRAASGAQLGSYRIVREIGHGGMGTVYLAERSDNQYQKTVALKVLRGWNAGDDRPVRRFLEERQILAALDHPDIARLFDGGVTPDGVPWFAMEYVDGVPIDRYCDERHLSTEDRLELFCRVCAAVQYAHRNLVVHRDLKPGNILVTDESAVKLLDFGIAKLLGGDAAGVSAALTATGERLMTPLYASPEQIRGDPISTASDVYALGVLLHELLTGRYPYRVATREPHDVVRAILEQEPERPSVAVLRPGDGSEGGDPGLARGLAPPKLARRLRGDLDTIVGTAMQKDPARRYGTAEQLEADVRRHIAGLPVTARPDSRLYRAQKFVRRHQVGVGIAAGVALLVVGFVVVTGIQSVRIRSQAARIAVERDRTEQVSRFLAGLFQTSDPYAGAGASLTAREILDSGAARVERELVGQPETRAQMMLEMGRAYFGLGLRDRARRFVETSLAIRRRASPEGQIEIAQTLDFLGVVLLEQGELEGAERASREALSLRQRLLGARHRDVGRTLNGLAAVLRAAGRFRVADSVSREAVTIDEGRSSNNRLDLAESLEGLAHAVRERGDFTAAVQLYGRVLALRRQELPEEHPEIATSVVNLAAALGDAGQAVAADSLFRYGLAVKRRFLGEGHPDVAADEAQYAQLLHRRGSDREAETLYRHSLATTRRRLPAVHAVTATTLLGLGELLLDRGAAEQAEPFLREGVGMRRATLPPGHPHLAEADLLLGAQIMARGRYLEAERYLLTGLAGLRAAYGDAAPRTRAALHQLVALYEASGQARQAAVYRAQLEGSTAPGPPRASDAGRAWDANIVAVFPFRISGEDPALADLRNGIQSLIANQLTGEGSPRALDPSAVLEALRRAGNSREDDLSLDASLRVGGGYLGAGWLLRGELAGTPRQLSIEASLVAVPRGAMRARARVEGSADSLPHLADRLAARLLAVLAAREGEDLAALTQTSLPALRAYLAGRSAYRRGRISDAEGQFERALFLDSTFALAGLGLAAVDATYGPRRDLDERWKLDAVWRQRDRLSPADDALLIAYLGPRYPNPSTLAELIAAGERAARAAPNRAEGWYMAGLGFWRYGSLISYPGWEARAAEALRSAVARDSAHAPALDLLFILAAGAGDRDGVRGYAGRLLTIDSASESADFLRWRAAVALGDGTALAAVRRRFGELSLMSLQRIVLWSQQHGVGLEDADRVAAVYLRRAESATAQTVAGRRVVTLLLNRGRPAEATRLLATAERGLGRQVDVGILEFRIYAALYWDGDSSEAAAAAQRLEAYVRGAPAGWPDVRDRQTASCALAHWRLATGDLDGVRAALEGMRRPATTTDSLPSESTPVCVAAAEAQLAAGRHEPNAEAALDRLDKLLRAGSDSRHLLPDIGNLIAARLSEPRGDLRRALEAIRRRDVWNDFLSTQLREEGRLAALTGDRAGAIRAYRHYLGLRSDPDQRLRQEVDRVRTDLRRLERDVALRERPR